VAAKIDVLRQGGHYVRTGPSAGEATGKPAAIHGDPMTRSGGQR
jgi:hypothetical protein